tara:strand:+ start:330 stop:542 length:213 start_codon:yes stop_codon:yes gene_type:complete
MEMILLVKDLLNRVKSNKLDLIDVLELMRNFKNLSNLFSRISLLASHKRVFEKKKEGIFLLMSRIDHTQT